MRDSRRAIVLARPAAAARATTVRAVGADGKVAFTLTLWGPPGLAGPEVVAERVDALRSAAASATASVGGRVPA